MSKRKATAKALRKKKYSPKKISFGAKLRNFFFPQDFGAQVAKGMHISSPYGISAIIYKLFHGLGKLARKVVDPRHKMKVGKERKVERANPK